MPSSPRRDIACAWPILLALVASAGAVAAPAPQVPRVDLAASHTDGGSLDIILDLAARLDRLGYEWVVFTATRELIGMFARLGLPLLVLNKADPARLGADAAAWGRYYDTGPIVVAGRIRIGLDRMGKARGQS